MKKTPIIDGRRKRKITNKLMTTEAILDLILETGKVPSIEEMAERSGVSRRSVFRFFNNKAELYSEMHNLMLQRVRSGFSLPVTDPERPLEETVRRWIDLRIQINEYVMPLRTLVEEKKSGSSLIQDRLKDARQFEQQFIHDLFAPYLHHHPEKESIQRLLLLNCSWNVWSVLRNDYGMSIDESRILIEKQICILLGI
ncbi:MAG: TetR/AcrR family transcriptional regulator [Thermodesulfobacteriota bacterium]